MFSRRRFSRIDDEGSIASCALAAGEVRCSAGASTRLDRMDLLCNSDGVFRATLFGCCMPLLTG